MNNNDILKKLNSIETKIDTLLKNAKVETKEPSNLTGNKDAPKRTMADVLKKMTKDGFFKNDKNVSEIKAGLKECQFNGSDQLVNESLKTLVKNNILLKKGKPKKYTYIIKKGV